MASLINVRLLVLFICTSWSLVSGKLLIRPMDVVVALGKTVQLNCSTDDTYGVNWWHVPVGSKAPEDVFISRVVVLPYYPRFKVERKEVENNIHDYNLVIASVRGEDAGKYTCVDRVGHGEQWHAQLVVLESGPQCHSNIDGEEFVGDNDCDKPPDEIRCSCSLQYSGNNPPATEWANSAGQIIEPRPPVNNSQTNIISSNLMVNTSLAMSGMSIVWRPELLRSINWTSPDIKVKYVVKNGRNVNVAHGESVVCRANSSETCTYKWTTQNGTIVNEEANLTIVNTGTYICDATCSLHNDNCTVRSMVAAFKKTHEGNAKEASKETDLTAATAGAVIGAVLVSSIVAVSLTVYYLRTKRRNEKSIDLPPRAEKNDEHIQPFLV